VPGGDYERIAAPSSLLDANGADDVASAPRSSPSAWPRATRNCPSRLRCRGPGHEETGSKPVSRRARARRLEAIERDGRGLAAQQSSGAAVAVAAPVAPLRDETPARRGERFEPRVEPRRASATRRVAPRWAPAAVEADASTPASVSKTSAAATERVAELGRPGRAGAPGRGSRACDSPDRRERLRCNGRARWRFGPLHAALARAGAFDEVPRRRPRRGAPRGSRRKIVAPSAREARTRKRRRHALVDRSRGRPWEAAERPGQEGREAPRSPRGRRRTPGATDEARPPWPRTPGGIAGRATCAIAALTAVGELVRAGRSPRAGGS